MDHTNQLRIIKILDHVYDMIVASTQKDHQHHELDNMEAEEYERSTLDPGLKLDCERVLNLCKEEDMKNAGSTVLSSCEYNSTHSYLFNLLQCSELM